MLSRLHLTQFETCLKFIINALHACVCGSLYAYLCVRVCATVKKTVNFSADQLQIVTETFLLSVAFAIVVVAVNKSGMQKFPHTHTRTQLQFKVRKIMGKQKQQPRQAGKQVNDSKWLKRS